MSLRCLRLGMVALAGFAAAWTQPAVGQGAAVATAPMLLLPPEETRASGILPTVLQRYPELFEGDTRDGVAVLAITLHADGTAVESWIRHTNGGEFLALAEAQLYRMLPIADGDGLSRSAWQKDLQVGDKLLRTDLVVMSTRVPPGFDPARSARRVREIVQQQRPHLMLPATDGGMNRLMVFLGDDGQILRENVERMSIQDIRPAPADDGNEQRFAQIMATVLQVDEARLGVMGATTAMGAEGMLFVVYAWERGSGELAPRIYGQPPAAPAFDSAMALAVVNRHLPDVFSRPEQPGGTPAILLSKGGEVIRAGWLSLQGGGLTGQALADPLLAGVRITNVRLERLSNSSGVNREVFFVWGTPGSPDATPAP